MPEAKNKRLRWPTVRRAAAVHPIVCPCSVCAPRPLHRPRRSAAIKAATRVLLLSAALIAIPFFVARALASMQSEWR